MGDLYPGPPAVSGLGLCVCDLDLGGGLYRVFPTIEDGPAIPPELVQHAHEQAAAEQTAAPAQAAPTAENKEKEAQTAPAETAPQEPSPEEEKNSRS